MSLSTLSWDAVMVLDADILEVSILPKAVISDVICIVLPLIRPGANIDPESGPAEI